MDVSPLFLKCSTPHENNYFSFLCFFLVFFFFLSLFSFLSSFLAPLVRGIVFTTSEHWISEASKLNILAIQNNRLNQHGTPFLHDMYLKAFAATDSYFGMYANGDILFSEDFVTTMCSLKSAIDHGVIKERVLLGERREKDNDSIPFCIIFFFFLSPSLRYLILCTHAHVFVLLIFYHIFLLQSENV